MTTEAATAAQAGLLSCEACQMLSRPAAPGQQAYCRRCGEKLEFRHHASIQKTWDSYIETGVMKKPIKVTDYQRLDLTPKAD